MCRDQSKVQSCLNLELSNRTLIDVQAYCPLSCEPEAKCDRSLGWILFLIIRRRSAHRTSQAPHSLLGDL
jgi:hypothetical protein